MRSAYNVPGTPPAGLFLLEGQLLVRRFVPVLAKDITCCHSHPMRINGRMFSGTPQCEHRSGSGGRRCLAHLYLLRVTSQRYFLLDVNGAEADMISHGHGGRGWDFDDVVVHFGLDFRKAG